MGIESMTPSVTRYGAYTAGPPPRRRPSSIPTRHSYLRPTTNNLPDGTCF
jgi:hypothetical protein